MRQKNCSDKKFTTLSFGCSSFHLSALEAVTPNHAGQTYATKKRLFTT